MNRETAIATPAYVEDHQCEPTLPDKNLRVNSSKSLQIPCWLAPPVLEDDIGQRDTANWTEPSHVVADRQQSTRMDARWQAKRGL